MSSSLLHPDVAALAKLKGFDRFTEVQLKAFPKILEGKDALLIAPTGFGKTEAAVLPILSKLAEAKGDGVRVLYVTPLRALNRDMLSRLAFYCGQLGLRLGVRHGDTSSYERQKQRAQPPHVLITTPESLNALLVFGMRDALKNVRFVVVDEVHELAYSKRGSSLALALSRLRLLSDFQIIGLSATVSAPPDVASFLGPKTEVIDCSHLRALDLSVVDPKAESRLPGLTMETSARLQTIERLVRTHQKTLIFVNTRFMAEGLGSLLRGVLGEEFAVHHSSLSREARMEVEDAFKAGSLRALVCTSSLELGMDIGEVDLVIQVGSPRQVSRLVQRVGRSGHKKSLTPKGVVLSMDPIDHAEAEVLVRRAHAGRLEPVFARPAALDVLAHHAVGLALEYGPVKAEHVASVFSKAKAFSRIKAEDVSRVFSQLASEGLVAFDGKTAQTNKRTVFYYTENLSTIADEKKFFVKNSENNKNVALLDEAFVSNYLGENATFIARGRAWRVLSIADRDIVVEPAREASAAIPDWVGEEIPVPFSVAQDVRAHLGGEAQGVTDGCFVAEVQKNLCVLHTFLGHKANEALSKAVSFLFSAQGVSVRSRASAYGILFEFSKDVPSERLRENLMRVRTPDLSSFLRANLPDSPLFLTRFVHVAKRFGLLRKDREYKAVSVKRLAQVMKDTVIAEEVFNELFYDKLDPVSLSEKLPSELLFVRPEKWSRLSRQALESGGFSELFAPAEPTEQVVQALKEDLAQKKVKLRCSFCKQSFSKILGTFNPAVCMYCQSSQVVPEEFFGKKEESRVASLVSAYGQKALFALSVYGVGPETAARVLGRLHKKEEDFFFDLLSAQKDFIRTKKFWKA